MVQDFAPFAEWSYDLESSHPIGTLVHHLPGHAPTSPAPSSPGMFHPASCFPIKPQELMNLSSRGSRGFQSIPQKIKWAKKNTKIQIHSQNHGFFFTARKFRKLKTPQIPSSWWFQPTPSKNMLVKMGSSSPSFGVKIKKC